MGLGIAIAWFTLNNYTVCIPLTDSQPYDLVVDDGYGLKRVSVRTSTRSSGEVGLRTIGGNKSQTTIKKFQWTQSDLLFLVDNENRLFLIPTNLIPNTASITPKGVFRNYQLSGIEVNG